MGIVAWPLLWATFAMVAVAGAAAAAAAAADVPPAVFSADPQKGMVLSLSILSLRSSARSPAQ